MHLISITNQIVMPEPIRVLFISQEIFPYLQEETPMRLLCRKLPEYCQANGCDTRTFMPKFGEINERRNQLHEVIRLSGTNIMISDMDHPILIKVASIQSARLQVYFIDNDDYFRRRKGVMDEEGVEYADNDERTIFFARAVLETVRKLRWTPDIVHCSGWMASLVPLYLKKAYADTLFFEKAKVVFSLYDQTMNRAFPENFARKLRIEGIEDDDIKSIIDRRVTYTSLMHLAIDNSDAVVQACPVIPKAMQEYIGESGKRFVPYNGDDPKSYLDLYRELLGR